MRSPSRSPCRELETNWGNLVKVAGEIRRHEAIILSDEEPPKAVSRSADIAARAFRKDGRVWLLAVNKTASPAWTFLGKPGLPDVPEPDCFSTAAVGPSLGYVRRKGQHGISGHDWQWMLDFADRILGK